MRDLEIQSAVEKELDWEPSFNAAGIHVDVSDGVVTLGGHVASYPERHEAEGAAGRVRGVRAVVNRLEVRIVARFDRADEDVAKAAWCAIRSNPELPIGCVRISVDNGRVGLEGVVDYRFQRASADRSVRYLAGVRDVNNHIMVKPHPKRKIVKSHIEAALLRRANLDARGIRVDVDVDQILLGGTVQSWVQRTEAERVAWASPGVCSVVNNITVNPSLEGVTI